MIISLHALKGDDIYAKIIQNWTNSPWCHVALSIGNTSCQAWASKGVVMETDKKFLLPYWDSFDLTITREQTILALNEMNNVKGAKYDWAGAILSAGLGIHREHPSKWQCSELAVHILMTTLKKLPDIDTSGYTPKSAVEFFKQLGGTSR